MLRGAGRQPWGRRRYAAMVWPPLDNPNPSRACLIRSSACGSDAASKMPVLV